MSQIIWDWERLQNIYKFVAKIFNLFHNTKWVDSDSDSDNRRIGTKISAKNVLAIQNCGWTILCQIGRSRKAEMV